MSTVRLTGWLICACGVTGAIAMAIGAWTLAPDRQEIAPASISSGAGVAHIIGLPDDRYGILRASRDAFVLLPSAMRLLEDGRAIGWPVQTFDEVAEKGGGRFAYVHPVVAFSASDGSDPQTNGRAYSIERPIKPRLAAWCVTALAVLIGSGLAFPDRMRSTAIALLRVGPSPDIASRARDITRSWLATSAVLVATTLVAVAELLMMWWASASTQFSIAGFLPVSDALGYYNCAVWIGAIDPQDASASLNDWCARRILYPSVLSSVLGLAGWRPSVALLAQAAAIGLSAGVLLLALQRSFGWITAILTTLAVLAFAREVALGSFVTEAFGLPAGLIGLALLLLAVSDREISIRALVLGLLVFSVGMAMRAGAMFSLPLLLLWVWLITRSMARRKRVALMVFALAAVAAGPLLQYTLVAATGGNPANSGGNFAASLYGLSTGSRDWSQAYRDFAETLGSKPETIAFQAIQQAALDNIVQQPTVFVGSLIAAGKHFAQSLFTFGPFAKYNTLTTWLFCFGLGLCALHFRRPAASLLLILCAGDFLSAPFVYDSGGHRVFAVSVAARIAVVAYAIAWFAGLLVRHADDVVTSGAAAANPIARDRLPVALASVMGLTLIALAVVPVTWVSSTWRLAPITLTKSCPADQLEVIARPGRESIRISFGVRSLPLDDEELGSPVGTMESDPTLKQEWWGREFPAALKGTEILYAVRRDPQNLGTVVAAFSRAPLEFADDRPRALCLTRQPSAEMKIGDLTGHQIMSIVDSAR